MGDTKERTAARRLALTRAKAQVEKTWGPAYNQLGAALQRALVAEAVLGLAAAQDADEVTADAVRRLVEDGWDYVQKEGA